MKDDREERTVNLKSTVVVDESQLPEFVHEGIDSGASCAHHLGQNFLADFRDLSSLAYAVFAEAGE